MGGTVVFKGQAELSAALMRKADLDAVKKVVRANGQGFSSGQSCERRSIPVRCFALLTCRSKTADCLPWCSHTPSMLHTLNLAHGKWRRSHMSNRRSIPLKLSSLQTAEIINEVIVWIHNRNCSQHCCYS